MLRKWILAMGMLLISMLVVDGSIIHAQEAGSEEALTLVSSAPENGAKDIATGITIELLFNKNVVNTAVQETNKKAISLKTKAGETVEIQIQFPDDQVDRDHRQNIYVDPVADLQPGTEYVLTIDETLKAKNGNDIDQIHTITFLTKADSVTQQTETTNLTDDGSGDAQKKVTENTKQEVQKQTNRNTLILIPIAALLLGGGIYLFRRKQQ